MTKEDVLEVQKEWETYDWQRGLSLICRIQCTKEHAVIARTVEILKKCGCTTEDATILRGGKAAVYNVAYVYRTYCTYVFCWYVCAYICTV